MLMPADYAGHALKQPFINVEEKIDRFVGRRTKTPDVWPDLADWARQEVFSSRKGLICRRAFSEKGQRRL